MRYRAYFKKLKSRMQYMNLDDKNEILKHINYLSDKTDMDIVDILSGKRIKVENQILKDAITNINEVIMKSRSHDISNSYQELLANNMRGIYLGRDLMLCKMRWGGTVVCPTWNVDVAVGLIKEGIHEEALTNYLLTNVREGECFINVGSNFGYYTVMAACKVGSNGKVYGFEANPVVFPILMKTLYYSGYFHTIDIYNRAVSNVSGQEITMNFDYQLIGGGSIVYNNIQIEDETIEPFWSKNNIYYALDNHGMYKKDFGFYQKVSTETITLDDAVQHDDVDWILCDAELADPLVILGAKRIISNSPNIKIIFEWNSDNYKILDDKYREEVKSMWDYLYLEGFVIKHISPYLHNGQTVFSNQISFSDFVNECEHGDYIAYRNGLGM